MCTPKALPFKGISTFLNMLQDENMDNENTVLFTIKSDEFTDDTRLEIWLRQNQKTNVEQKAKRNKKLSVKQRKLLKILQKPGDYIEAAKKRIKINDLPKLAAVENVEFSLFTKRARRILVRGTYNETPIEPDLLVRLKEEGWKFSAHTHPVKHEAALKSSPNDARFLQMLGQDRSVILSSNGLYKCFNKSGVDL